MTELCLWLVTLSAVAACGFICLNLYVEKKRDPWHIRDASGRLKVAGIVMYMVHAWSAGDAPIETLAIATLLLGVALAYLSRTLVYLEMWDTLSAIEAREWAKRKPVA